MTDLDKIIEDKAEEFAHKISTIYKNGKKVEGSESPVRDPDLHEGFKEGAKFALTPEVLIHCPEVKALVEALDQYASLSIWASCGCSHSSTDAADQALKPFQNLGGDGG